MDISFFFYEVRKWTFRFLEAGHFVLRFLYNEVREVQTKKEMTKKSSPIVHPQGFEPWTH